MDYSPCPEKEIWPFLKGSHISETGGVMPTKTGVHARDIDPYLHELFEPILSNYIFPLQWTIAHGLKGKFGQIWKKQYPQNQEDHPILCQFFDFAFAEFL